MAPLRIRKPYYGGLDQPAGSPRARASRKRTEKHGCEATMTNQPLNHSIGQSVHKVTHS